MRIQFRRAVWSLFFLAFAAASAAQAQPRLVVDLNRERARIESPPGLEGSLEHDGVRYFIGHDPQHGEEIWRTDGTRGGTYRLIDLCPGTCGGEIELLSTVRGTLYFLGSDGEHGREVWGTDGTVGGEKRLIDACAEPCWNFSTGWAEWRGEFWVLLESTSDPIPVLWASDGTREGTRPVANLCTDLSFCRSYPDDPSSFLGGPDPSGQGLLLWTLAEDSRSSLFRTDGTAAGTVLLHRFGGLLSAKDGSKVTPASFTTHFGRIARTAAEASDPLYFLDGRSLWTSDGTPSGTHLVRSLEGLVQYEFLQSSEVVGGIFYATFYANEWLRSDGTAEGTFLLGPVVTESGVRVARIGNSAFALTYREIWRTGGTPQTTFPFEGPVGEILHVVEQPDRLIVMSREQTEGPFLWTTDGTPAGTRRIQLGDGPSLDPHVMAAFEDGVLVSRGDFRGLWRVDDTGAERLMHDFQIRNGGSGPNDQIVLDNRLLFFSLANARRANLFSSDGTAAGTIAIPAAEGRGTPDYLPYETVLTRAGKKAFFGSRGRIWSTDGFPQGTRSFRPPSSYTRFRMEAPIGFLGGQFIFSANLDVNEIPHCPLGDSEPWVSDGAHGTKQLINLNPFYWEDYGNCTAADLSSSPGRGVVLGPVALFAADDLLHGRELFATDGTKAGTRLVADINRKVRPFDGSGLLPRPPHLVGVGSDPSDLVRAGSRVFFVADDGKTGRELWVTNGTYGATRRVADLVPGSGSSTPRYLVAVGTSVYFFAAHGTGEGLFRSDGTRRGTVLVSDLAGASQARDLTVVRGRLFFVAFRPETGTELWTSEGGPETTREVIDLRPGPRGSLPQNLKAVGARVVFAAEDGESGLEPWSSDGTAEGTVRWGDIAPGRDASTPGPFSIANGQVLFGADDGEHGRELWAIPLADVAEAAAPR